MPKKKKKKHKYQNDITGGMRVQMNITIDEGLKNKIDGLVEAKEFRNRSHFVERIVYDHFKEREKQNKEREKK